MLAQGEPVRSTPVESALEPAPVPVAPEEQAPIVAPEKPSPTPAPEGAADADSGADFFEPSSRNSWIAALFSHLPRLRGRSRPLPQPIGAPELSGVDSPPEAAGMLNVRDFNPALVENPDRTRSSDEFFVEVGRQLRTRREMLSLTYEEIERHTHVRTAFLVALERGALDDLPSPVQTRGILVNYAGFLDLDVDSILLLYADGLQARHRERGPQRPVHARAPMTVNTTLPPLRSFIASDLVFGGGLAIILLLFALWGISRVMTVRSEMAVLATPPSISEILAGTALPTLDQQVTVIPAQLSPSPAVLETTPTLDLATLDPHVKVKVDLSASERTYLRVTVDGKLKFEGRTDLSSAYSYEAAQQVEVLVGNGSAISVVYNGHDLGLMGNFGEVVDRLYTAEGVATPTSTPAPTRTPTPFVTRTPTETPTLTPSPTRTSVPGG